MGWARNDYGHDIDVVTCGFKKQVMSTFNIQVLVDKTIEEVCVDDYDALAIPGGFEEFGFYDEAYDSSFLNLIGSLIQRKNNRFYLCGSIASWKKWCLKIVKLLHII
ncbi:DJ-1/PfpI family protein [Clostridioides difficile]|uniref:DJ-1/PfpI family protein n=1 Tax=Clostridioides difficile TaxID=1496 RepID=UPI002ED06688